MKGAGITLLGSDQNPENHWTMATYDVLSNEVIYGDSLGQMMPDELMVKMSHIIEMVFETKSHPSLCYSHDPDIHSHSHDCIGTCASNYPLQTCSSICGVVCVVFASIAVKGWNYFLYLAKAICK